MIIDRYERSNAFIAEFKQDALELYGRPYIDLFPGLDLVMMEPKCVVYFGCFLIDRDGGSFMVMLPGCQLFDPDMNSDELVENIMKLFHLGYEHCLQRLSGAGLVDRYMVPHGEE